MKTESSLLTFLVTLFLVSDFAWCALGGTWTLTSAPTTNWMAVASSADGGKLVAVIYGGGIYVSTNSGEAWTPTGAPITNWTGTASSADGIKLVAVARNGNGNGAIFVSTNGGATWTDSGAPYYPWQTVGSSADGGTLLAAWWAYPVGGGLFLSTNGGTAWADANVLNLFWYGVSLSADGSKLVALGNTGLGHFGTGAIGTSANGGATWESSEDQIAVHLWIAVAGSADGWTLVGGTPGGIWTSEDFGGNWETTGPSNLSCLALACSADGIRMAGVLSAGCCRGYPGTIYTSADSGATWISSGSPNLSWSSVASSSDGCKLVAVEYGGGIYTWQTTPHPFLNLTWCSTNLVVSWLVPSQRFALQENSDLTTTNWTDLATAPVLNLTNLQNQVTLPLSASNRFYRLKASLN
jgi:hypothetical protein